MNLPQIFRHATLLSLTVLTGFTGCAQPVATPSVPAKSSTGAPVTQTNEECRVPQDASAALTGNYRATVQTSIYGSVQLDWNVTAETIAGYSGRFLQSRMTINGSRGTSTQVSLLCTEVIRSGSVLLGARLRSEPVAFGPFDYIYSRGQLITDHQMAVSSSGGGSYLFDPTQSWMVFKDSSGTQTLSATVSGLQKL